MKRAELICPAGTAGKTKASDGRAGARRAIARLRNLFRTAPAAMHGDSGAVMDKYMKYHKEHSGE